MIEAHIVEVMIKVGDMVLNNEPLKIKWRSKVSEVKDKVIGKESYLDMKIIRMSNATTVKNLDIMPRIAGTGLKILPISSKQ